MDSSGTVWFSQPDQDFITSFDPLTSLFTSFPAPYPAANPAIPVESSAGTI